MNKSLLINHIKSQKSFLCIGIDPDINRLPTHIERTPDGVEQFCIQIIEATHPFCVSYKLNTAFFEVLGPKGMQVFENVVRAIPKTHFVISDAKRGDIGNTSRMYAQTFFEFYATDAITVSPYMGHDSLQPFFDFKDKFTIVLGLTSNAGSEDFELLHTIDNIPTYLNVMKKVSSWATSDQLMFVVGATKPDQQAFIRAQFPDYFFLVPGIGAQGGDVQQTCNNLLTPDFCTLISSSRDIIYASSQSDFTDQSALRARELSETLWKIHQDMFPSQHKQSAQF